MNREDLLYVAEQMEATKGLFVRVSGYWLPMIGASHRCEVLADRADGTCETRIGVGESQALAGLDALRRLAPNV